MLRSPGAMKGAARIGAARSDGVSFLMLLGLVAAGCNRPLPQAGDGGPDSGVLTAADSGAPAPDSGSPIADGGVSAPDTGAGWSAPPLCALPFDAGPCDGAVRVYAFVDGACVQRGYGGCEGNDNRFQTLEECLATCEGRPAPHACPAGRRPGQICLACGPAGGCSKQIDACVLACDPAVAICTGATACIGGTCQMPCR
jgi:hypothetical protein